MPSETPSPFREDGPVIKGFVRKGRGVYNQYASASSDENFLQYTSKNNRQILDELRRSGYNSNDPTANIGSRESYRSYNLGHSFKRRVINQPNEFT